MAGKYKSKMGSSGMSATGKGVFMGSNKAPMTLKSGLQTGNNPMAENRMRSGMKK